MPPGKAIATGCAWLLLKHHPDEDLIYFLFVGIGTSSKPYGHKGLEFERKSIDRDMATIDACAVSFFENAVSSLPFPASPGAGCAHFLVQMYCDEGQQHLRGSATT